MKTIFKIFNFLPFVFAWSCGTSQMAQTTPKKIEKPIMQPVKTDSFLHNLLAQHPQHFDSILKNQKDWNVQIIYTQINRTTGKQPQFEHHYFGLDTPAYFYPASTVKLPVAALALQRLNELKISGLEKETTFITEAAALEQTPVYNDPTTETGKPTIAQYIKKILLVSDNDAYNRLYEFLGQEYINTSLHKMGYDSAQIIHRLSLPLNEDQNRLTNPIKFLSPSGKTIYEQAAKKSSLVYAERKTQMGNGYLNGEGLIEKPFDFSKKNRLYLKDLHHVVQSIIFPEAVPAAQRFNLTADDYYYLRKYMSMKPGESRSPQYDTTYPDGYVKFLMFGGSGAMPDSNIRIFNKPGDAYGFLTDAAYIVDFKNGVEFLVSATIYCNSDGVFNDDNYDYETVGFPFLKNLGEVLYQYELARPKKVKPDLTNLKYDYQN